MMGMLLNIVRGQVQNGVTKTYNKESNALSLTGFITIPR